DLPLHALAVLEHVGDVERRAGEALQHGGELEEQGIVESGVHTDEAVRGGGAPADELGDGVLVVEDLPECEEVLLPGAEGELAHGIAEGPLEVGGEKLQGVDPKCVDVKFRNDVLVAADEDVWNHREAS